MKISIRGSLCPMRFRSQLSALGHELVDDGDLTVVVDGSDLQDWEVGLDPFQSRQWRRIEAMKNSTVKSIQTSRLILREAIDRQAFQIDLDQDLFAKRLESSIFRLAELIPNLPLPGGWSEVLTSAVWMARAGKFNQDGIAAFRFAVVRRDLADPGLIEPDGQAEPLRYIWGKRPFRPFVRDNCPVVVVRNKIFAPYIGVFSSGLIR